MRPFFDRFEINVKKGMKEEYKKAAQDRGLGLAELVKRGIDEYIINHPVEEVKEK